MIELEYSPCGLCGSEEFIKLYPAPEFSEFSGCAIVQCCECGLVRTNPRPDLAALMQTYSSEYYSYQAPHVEGLASRIKVLAMKLSQPLLYPYVIPHKIPHQAAICDVGCGAGQWLMTMRAAYPEARLCGFEIDDKVAAIAAQSVGADVRTGDFLNNHWPANSFDFITFWDVLEHVPNPEAVMREVTRLLKPGGHVVVIAPDFDCIYSKIFHQFWWALLYDQHLYHFNASTLTTLFSRCKLQVVKHSLPFHLPHSHWNIANWLKDLEYKKLDHTIKYKLLSALMSLIAPVDRIQLTRILPQHFMMSARKPLTDQQVD